MSDTSQTEPRWNSEDVRLVIAAGALTEHQPYWHDDHGWRCICGWRDADLTVGGRGSITSARLHQAERVISYWIAAIESP